MADPAKPHVVVVGAGFGGLYAVRQLRRESIRVTLVDRQNHHLFQPLLYQVATAGLSANEIAYPVRAIFSDDSDVRVLLGEVVDVDLENRRVILEDDAVDYDRLIVAAGSEYHYFGNDEWAEFAPPLKSLDDALEIRRRILLAFEHAERETDPSRREQLMTFAIVGGGPTGVELAGAIVEIACRVLVDDFRSIDPREAKVVLVEADERILQSFPETLSAAGQRMVEQLGVTVRTKAPVASVDARGLALADGSRIDAATVIWAAGVRANPLAERLAEELGPGGRVPVQPDLSLPGHPEVFVVGDMADARDADGQQLPGVAPVAIQQGEYVAAAIAKQVRGEVVAPFDYWDKGNLATIGRARAVAQVAGFELAGAVAWLAWLGIHVFFLIGFRNRAIVLFDWAYAYLTWNRSARLILGLGKGRAPAAEDDERKSA